MLHAAKAQLTEKPVADISRGRPRGVPVARSRSLTTEKFVQETDIYVRGGPGGQKCCYTCCGFVGTRGEQTPHMDILYCGDANIEHGLLISALSVARQMREPLRVHVMTMGLAYRGREVRPVDSAFIAYLGELLAREVPGSSAHRIDVTRLFCADPPYANMRTRFTPCCMLRLYADQVEGLPDRLLYLDTDVVCRRDCSELWRQDMEGWEFAGVLDYYGRWYFRRNPLRLDYVNSGVLLLNLGEIRRTGLFERCRRRCATHLMAMPDQSSLNKLARAKRILPRRFNEQHGAREDTVLEHFTTRFRFWPYPRTQTVKPWDIDRMHEILGVHEYDGLLAECRLLMDAYRATKS